MAIAFTPAHDFFIGFDSDGCVFDSMELKHRECFVPMTVWKWELQRVSRFARECHEFVNLHSKWRGTNRFSALVRTLELLGERPEARQRGYTVPDLTVLKDWIASAALLSHGTLQKYVEMHDDPLLLRTLEWSAAVNQQITMIANSFPPFPVVEKALAASSHGCDLIVVSQTPTDALRREWRAHGLDEHVLAVCGQELGSKDQIVAATAGERYAPQHVLVVGDAYGDLKAARAADALFYPVLVGGENECWERFVDEAYPRFIGGTFAGAYQDGLIAEMERLLPERPPWDTGGRGDAGMRGRRTRNV